MRRVVVTGMGIVSPLGQGVKHNWSELISCKSGIKKIEKFKVDDINCRIAGIIPENDNPGDLNLNDFFELKELRKIDRFIQLGLVASIEAVEDSKWVPKNTVQQNRTGVMIGSGIGGLQSIVETSNLLNDKGPRRISPFFIPSALINLISGQVSIRFGFKGPNHSVVTACSTGAHAIGDAARLIAIDDADVMLAGGAEAAVCRLGIAGFAASRALSTSYNDNPESASRPYDKGRDGFVMGEGAGVIMLEELNHALDRDATIYAELKGYGLSGDAYHITAPEETGDGGFRAMEMASKRAKIEPFEIDYINSHGTSTPLGDLIEAKAIKRLFKNKNNLKNLSVSSTKSSIGHLLGAAGSVESIYSILSILNDIVPPTLNLTEVEDGLDELDLVPLKPLKKKIKNAMTNSFGFGGTNASLIFSKYIKD